ncbi:MAG: response regulator, partial [Saprospiraceae bacterium]|nr:response regulator [Saprospiraceae bacterium]
MPTKILYVEDEVFLGKIVKESLETRGYEVQWIKDGKEAVAAFQTELPDICVLDVMLPHKDGFTVGKEIRAAKDDVPIIYLTAKDQT